jgi:hypothetical protein
MDIIHGSIILCGQPRFLHGKTSQPIVIANGVVLKQVADGFIVKGGYRRIQFILHFACKETENN